jgi:hypothetical protein
MIILVPLELAAFLGFNIVFKEAYSKGIPHFWYLWMDIRFVLPYVQFDNGFSISVVKNKATRYKK